MLLYSVMHWSALTSEIDAVMDMSGHVAPSEYPDREGISYCCRTTHDGNALTNAVEIYDSDRQFKNCHGHKDYSFASAWHPGGQVFATGNQDKACRLWDVRNLSKSLAVFRGNIGAIRSIYSFDGQFMAMAEPADFVHIFDVGSGYTKRQELDFFGEVSGMSFSSDTEALFIGIWGRTYASLLQYSRSQNCIPRLSLL